MRLLVCGGRDFKDLPFLDQELDRLHAERRVKHVITGCAPGADLMAQFWAGANEIPVDVYVADWKKHGRAAGPIRNQRMLDEGRPDLVVAFPGGRGTADMTKRAKAAGVAIHALSEMMGVRS